MTVEEVCEALRIYALLGSGQLKGFRNGRSWRIPKEAVRRFILERAGLG
ncbi:helix-turn-helix domain-containing protein [uncultured Oscillibacter sp.]|nr:helix-turn-helix domain-containing protein [uncultured Oscillibacter sp.]